MANQKQAGTRRLKMSERAQQQLDLHFPNFQPLWLWRRKTNDGYTTLPRTLPLVMQAVDDQTKGQPAGHTLFCLWARSPDHPLVTIENPATFASEAGFDGERAVDTWRRRMKRLKDLNLILPKRGPSGDFHFVLLLNPNVGMEWMNSHGLVQQDLYARFIDRLIEVGGFGDVESIRALVQQQAAAAAAAASVPPVVPGFVPGSTAASGTPGAVPASEPTVIPVPPPLPANKPTDVAIGA